MSLPNRREHAGETYRMRPSGPTDGKAASALSGVSGQAASDSLSISSSLPPLKKPTAPVVSRTMCRSSSSQSALLISASTRGVSIFRPLPGGQGITQSPASRGLRDPTTAARSLLPSCEKRSLTRLNAAFSAGAPGKGCKAAPGGEEICNVVTSLLSTSPPPGICRREKAGRRPMRRTRPGSEALGGDPRLRRRSTRRCGCQPAPCT